MSSHRTTARTATAARAARLGGVGVVLCGLLRSAEAAPAAETAPSPAALIEAFCVDCHDSASSKGDLSFEELDPTRPAAAPAVWESVLRKLRHRQMPPRGRPRPDEAAYDGWIASLQAELDRAAAAAPHPGRTDSFRRLTRTEYHNAIRDLLLVDVDLSELLPKDEQSRGFDNVTVAELSPAALEKYLGAAKRVAALALGRPRPPSFETIVLPVDLTQVEHAEGLPLGTRGGTVIARYFPRDGGYDVTLRLARDRNEQVEGLRRPHQIELLVDGHPVRRFQVEPPPKGTDGKHDHVDRHLVARVTLTAGRHEVGATFLQDRWAVPESEGQPSLAHFNADRHPRPQPALYSISLAGPYDDAGPGDTPARRRLVPCAPRSRQEQARCARAVITELATRAYRHPATEDDVAIPLRHYARASAVGGFEAGIELAVRAILTSPRFLFRVEVDPEATPPATAYRIPDRWLASRLSFFLWSSVPDDELAAHAERGELADPTVLHAQVARMLRDPRAAALVDSFAAQWLHLRNLDTVRPDARLFSDFDANLRRSMRRETELFFASVVQEDRSVVDLLTADYTFLDERLAKHYGVPNVYGSEFRRVSLTGNQRRPGGILTQASILTVTSQPTRTSPVVRGNWILANVIGTPPKPPPPGVPQLKEKTAPGDKVPSMREQLAAHRKDKVCATCHDLMDPIGFALEHYDAVGRFRERDDGGSISGAGALPDGSTFEDAGGLERAIAHRPALFATAFTEKLLTYALGRGLDHRDAPAVRRIVADAATHGYAFSSIVQGIAASVPFQMRETP